MPVIIVIVILIICFGLFYASYSISAGVYVKSLCRNDDVKGKIAITFDDGVNAQITPKVLAVLKKHNAKATFFVIGKNASQHREIIKQIVEEGHNIGNHSYHHQWYFPMKCTSKIYKEIAECNQLLKNITGYDNKLFRPPFGVTNPLVARAIRKSGLISIGWSIRSLDTMGQEQEKVLNRITKKMCDGAVILLHDNRHGADKLLEKVLQQAQKQKLQPVTVNELFDL